MGRLGLFSFNGNKALTKSGGGMLVSADQALVDRARKLATQARDPAPRYEHSEMGYKCRLSNVLAGIGRGHLHVLEDRMAARNRNFDFHADGLGDLAGLDFMSEAPWGRHTCWLTTRTLDPVVVGATRADVRLALEAGNIEARAVWKPMHLQPVFAEHEVVAGAVANDLFERCFAEGENTRRQAGAPARWSW